MRPIFAISRLIGMFGAQQPALLQQDESLPAEFSPDDCSSLAIIVLQ
ncbi:MAG: hypothetical protein P8Q37_07835 [Porticoccaceae bacterium]|nr:hypothetical protein [Porticoccaceae bacterium]